MTQQSAGARSASEGPGASWRGQLKSLGPGPIALACGPRGVFGVTGAGSAQLSSISADWCFADPLVDAVWVGSGQQVFVLDLLSSAAPELVVDGAVGRFGIGWPDGQRRRLLTGLWQNETHFLVLSMSTLKVGAHEARFGFTLEEGELQRAEARAKVVGEAALKRLVRREQARQHESAIAPPSRRCKPGARLGVEHELGSCDDSRCFVPQDTLGQSSFCPMLVEASCGDGCYESWVLWDDEARRLETLGGLFPGVSPETGTLDGGGVNPAEIEISSDGRYFIVSGKLFNHKGQERQREFKDRFCGWL